MDLKEIVQFEGHRHPWEISRLRRILTLPFPKGAGIRFVDIGSGDLFFARALSAYTTIPVAAVDTGYVGGEHHDGSVRCYTAISDIAPESADCVFLMDVLEHVQDDRALLAEAARVLVPGGVAVITVPAFPRLFSGHDVFLGHCRRYDTRMLLACIGGVAPLAVQEIFYFYTILCLVRWVEKVFGGPRMPQTGTQLSAWRFSPQHWITQTAAAALDIDFMAGRFLHAKGLPIPGLSLCAFCVKK